MTQSQDHLKHMAAVEAISLVPYDCVVGVGTGSTVNFFIDELAKIKHHIQGAVASSDATADRLRAHGITCFDLNSVDKVPVYIDGADEINPLLEMIKGGGGALTREKILAAVSEQFIVIADESKQVRALGNFPIAIEVIPMARSYVAREIVKLGGNPSYRQGDITDNGNVLLDAHGLDLRKPIAMEEALNQIAGVVTNGLFARRNADCLVVAKQNGTEVLTR